MTDKKPFGFSQAEDSPGFLLWQVTTTWQRLIRGALHSYNISHSQFVIMAVIRWFEKTEQIPTQVLIGDFSKLDKMTISKSLKKLASEGYILRATLKEDTRTKCSWLTEKGRELVGKLVPMVEKIDEEFFGILGKDEERNLLESFLKLRKYST